MDKDNVNNSITISYDSISPYLTDNDMKTQINQIFKNKNNPSLDKPLPIWDFVKTAKLEKVVASVSIPSDVDSPLSITQINMDGKQIYPPQQKDGSKHKGGRKSRVSSGRGGGRKSRRRHNYI